MCTLQSGLRRAAHPLNRKGADRWSSIQLAPRAPLIHSLGLELSARSGNWMVGGRACYRDNVGSRDFGGLGGRCGFDRLRRRRVTCIGPACPAKLKCGLIQVSVGTESIVILSPL